MQLSISYWSVKDGLANTRPIEEAIIEAKEAGFDGIELACGTEGALSIHTDQKTVESFRALGEKHSIKLETMAAGLSWGCSPTDPNPEIRKRSIEIHTAALQRAAWLGAKAMLMVPGAVKIPWDPHYGPVKYDQALEWAKQSACRLRESAERFNVDLCLENVWNGLFYSPLEFASFLDDIGSPRVGAYLDVGNLLGYHQHPPHWIEILANRIKRVHLKDFKNSIGNITGFCDLLAGDVPWKETMSALRIIGYNKTLVAEMMPPDPTLLKRTKQAMEKIIAM